MTHKQCRRCGQLKPATTEFFHRRPAMRDGLFSICKTCGLERTKEWRAANRQKLNSKARTQYDAEKRRAAYLKRKAKASAVSRTYYANNKERAANASKRWKEKNKEAVKQRRRELMKLNPEKYRAWTNRRRARKAEAEGIYTGEDVLDQLKRQKRTCYWCKKKLGETYHVDHIVPLSRGGSNWPENLVIACVHCNESRQSRLPHEWPEGNRLL